MESELYTPLWETAPFENNIVFEKEVILTQVMPRDESTQ